MTNDGDPKNDLRAVIADVELRDIRLVTANVRTHVRDPSQLPHAQLIIKHGAKVIGRSDSGFLVGAMLRAQVVSGETDHPTGDAPVNMIITLSLEYALPNASGFGESVLNEFAQVNGTFNAWPYWREYIQTTAARMGLPPVILPVFRLRGPKISEPREPFSPKPEPRETVTSSKRSGKKK